MKKNTARIKAGRGLATKTRPRHSIPISEPELDQIVKYIKHRYRFTARQSVRDLASDINEFVELCAPVRVRPPHEFLEALDRIVYWANGLQDALEGYPEGDLLPPRLTLIETLKAAFSEPLIGIKLNSGSTSIAPTFAGELDRLVIHCEMIRKDWKILADTKAGKRSHDAQRYLFIRRLSIIFADYFGRKPGTTRNGPWCHFLAEVLTICEGRPVNEDGAFDLWRKVRSGMQTEVRGKP